MEEAVPDDLHAKRIEMPIDDRIGREDRRFDFEKAARVEKLPQPMEQCRTETQVFPCGRWGKAADMTTTKWVGAISFRSETETHDAVRPILAPNRLSTSFPP